MNARIRLHAIAAGLALLALTGTAQAQTTLSLSSWVPPTHYLVKDILQPWMADVEKATEGRVKINLLPKAVGAPPQHWELARKGVADITWGNFTYEPERFKHVWFAELPMMGTHAEASSVALWRTYDKYLSRNETFKGVTLLGTGMLGGGQFHHPSKVIDTPDDLKGQKVRMGGPIQKRLLEDLGAEGMPGVIIPRKTVGEMQRLIENDESEVRIELSQGKIRFTIGSVVLTSKLIDGTFPDYARVIPANPQHVPVTGDSFFNAPLS